MPNKYRRAMSAGDIFKDVSDDETESLLHMSTMSEGPDLNRRASQGCSRPIPIGYASRPGTPTRVLESSLRVSSPNLNRTPKSVRFKFPEQDHYEALAQARKEKEIDLSLPRRSQSTEPRVEDVPNTIKDHVTRLLEREARRHSSGDISDKRILTTYARGDFYFQTMEMSPSSKEIPLWRRGKMLFIVLGAAAICVILVLIPILIKLM